jgi:hypothetical protein
MFKGDVRIANVNLKSKNIGKSVKHLFLNHSRLVMIVNYGAA